MACITVSIGAAARCRGNTRANALNDNGAGLQSGIVRQEEDLSG
jgi:hypothetical protein